MTRQSWPVAFLYSVFFSVARWWRTRTIRFLWLGLPAVTVTVVAAAIVARAITESHEDLADRYEATADRALADDDLEAADVFYRKAVSLQPVDPALQYGLAITSARRGNVNRAIRLMRILAPRDKQGYARAHLWWAGMIIDSGDMSQERIQEAHAHLIRALPKLSNDAEVHSRLAQLYLAGGEPGRAVPHLRTAVRERPELRLQLAQLHASLGQTDEAVRQALMATEYLHAQIRKVPEDVETRIRYATACVHVNRFAAAEQTLKDGIALRPDSRLHKALAGVYLTWSDSFAGDSGDDLDNRLRLIHQSLQQHPGNKPALIRLINVGRANPDDASRTRDILYDLLATGRATHMIHLALGNDAWVRGEHDTALQHFEQAYKLNSGASDVLNDLAWTLAHAENPDLPRALNMINAVLSRSPDTANYRETRGQILAKMERWDDAREDLEAALPHMPGHRDLHRTLASVYGALNLQVLADKHLKLAAQ